MTPEEQIAAALVIVNEDPKLPNPRARLREILDPPAPPPPPPPPVLALPGTGAILVEDLATEANPSKIYGGQRSPVSESYEAQGQTDPFFEMRSGDGDPHVPIGLTAPVPGYRRLSQKAGRQSLSDIGVNRSTRTQAQTWSTTHNLMAFSTGRTLIHYVSFRLQDPSVLPHGQLPGGGINKFTQLIQFKAHGGGMGTAGVAMSITVGNDGIKFLGRRGEVVRSQIVKVPNGTWVRLALKMYWAKNATGWYEGYVHVDGDSGGLVQVAADDGLDMAEGRPSASLGIGPYNYLSLFDGSVSGQPANDYYCDYANVQLCEVQ